MRNLAFVAALLAACSSPASPTTEPARTLRAEPVSPDLAEAVFAGGCFWCMEAPFEQLDGVLGVVSGYTGGRSEGPTYAEVSSGGTGHAEAVRVLYDPRRVSYARLLEVYWHNVDPTQVDGQFCDHGDQYRTAIFVVSEEQRRLAERSRERVREQLGRAVVTEIVDAGPFWVAEAYHQDFHRTSPVRYRTYRASCGRDARLRALWGEAAAH
ncbi:MAG: peptide-methionine (S)-S-oxide reductase MsrA [Sandaracinaceae bacterium]|nr:peptide-methionine (S)-S-oxide reductase MsrA [Sandaracinaceae bacterium]